MAEGFSRRSRSSPEVLCSSTTSKFSSLTPLRRPQAAALLVGRVAVVVDNVEVFVVHAPQAVAGGRVTAVVENVEVFVAHAPQAAAGGRLAAGSFRRPRGGSRRQRRSFRRSRPSGGRRRPVAAGFSRQNLPSLLLPNQKPNNSVTTNNKRMPHSRSTSQRAGTPLASGNPGYKKTLKCLSSSPFSLFADCMPVVKCPKGPLHGLVAFSSIPVPPKKSMKSY